MSTWTITAHTNSGLCSILGAAGDPAAARAAAIRVAHACVERDDYQRTTLELHVDHQLVAIVGISENDDHSRHETHVLIDRLDHAVDPYSY